MLPRSNITYGWQHPWQHFVTSTVCIGSKLMMHLCMSYKGGKGVLAAWYYAGDYPGYNTKGNEFYLFLVCGTLNQSNNFM
jgi:hypothetical protein